MLHLPHEHLKILLSEVLTPHSWLHQECYHAKLSTANGIYMWCHHLSHINENGLKYLSSSETAKISHFCLYQISLLVFIAACTIACFLLLMFWRLFWMFGVSCLFLCLSCFSIKCSFCRLSPVSLQLTFHRLMLTWSFVSLIYSRSKTRTRNVLTCWRLDKVKAMKMCIMGPCWCVSPWSWSCTKMRQ